MVEIRNLMGGRFEVFAEGRHQEAFEGTLGAIAAAQALAGQICKETGAPEVIHTPWGDQEVSPASLRS